MVAGGACFVYNLERTSDGSGRRYTVATDNDREALVIELIDREYLAGRGQKAIAHQLNHEGVPTPSAGRLGSGSCAPSAVRTILLDARYRGVYFHGRLKKVRQDGGSIRVKVGPSEIIMIKSRRSSPSTSSRTQITSSGMIHAAGTKYAIVS